DRMRAVHVVKRHRTFEPLGLAPNPCAANDGLEIRRTIGRILGRHIRRVNHYHAATAFEERFECRTFVGGNLTALLGVQDEHVSLRELLGGGKFHRAVSLATALVEQRRPVFQKLLMLMLARTVGLLPATNEHAQRLGGGSGGGPDKRRNEEEERELRFHGCD